MKFVVKVLMKSLYILEIYTEILTKKMMYMGFSQKSMGWEGRSIHETRLTRVDNAEDG